jgi:hypothetical protein
MYTAGAPEAHRNEPCASGVPLVCVRCTSGVHPSYAWCGGRRILATLQGRRASVRRDSPCGGKQRILALTGRSEAGSLRALRYPGNILAACYSLPSHAADRLGRGASADRLLALAFIACVLCSFRIGAADAAPGTNAASPEVAPAIPGSVDLRPAFERSGLARRVQGKRGTCSVFVVAGALEFAAARGQQHAARLSVEFLNWAANRVVGQDKDGGFFSDLWRGFEEYGICAEDAMPYRASFDPAPTPTAEVLAQAKTRVGLGFRHHWIKEWNVKKGLTSEQFLAIKRTLNEGWPVCAGLRWPTQAVWADGVLQMCAAEAVYDGHSVLLVGYRDDQSQPGRGTFVFRNTAGGGRDGEMPYTYAQTYMNDALWIDGPARADGAP